MRANSPYRYRILLNNQQLGPFDRQTILAMRQKKLLGNNTKLLRSDEHPMTVALLVADRFEMADGQDAQRAGDPVISGLWPTFLVDFGGSWRSAGALGFTGRGELRFQGDTLRLVGNKARFLGSTPERIKLAIAGINSVEVGSTNQCQIELYIKSGQPFPEAGKLSPAVLTLDDIDAVKELLSLLGLTT